MPPTSANGSDPDYLRDQPPASAALRGGLSIFAAVVVLRLCIRRYQRWRSRRATQLNEKHTLFWQDAITHPPYLSRTQQPHHCNMNEKAQGTGNIGGNNNKHDSKMDSQEEHAGGDRRHLTGADGMLRNLISRPPPAPPLTPPELSSTVFTLEGRPGVQESFFDQPNPDYTSPSTTSSGSRPSTNTTATSHHRRLSYQKTIPIGVPVSRQSSACESDLYFSPSSFPSASPLLPPAPPVLEQPSPEEELSDRREINVHGEIISVLDSKGHGWSRHTRVYGGGVCLACASTGQQHGEGGFYGPNVLPEEMR